MRFTFLAGVLLVLVGVGMLAAGCASQPTAAAEGEASQPGYWRTNWEERGHELYRQNCATCHGEQGEGKEDVFPALAGSELVTGPIGGVVILPMFGRGAMPSFSSILNDEEMALVLSYIRTAWGNSAEMISPSQVETFRQEGIDVPLEPILGGAA